jgi:hypothetical protein
MFLNQLHYAWRDVGRSDWLRAALLLIGPLAMFWVLTLLAKGTG